MTPEKKTLEPTAKKALYKVQAKGIPSQAQTGEGYKRIAPHPQSTDVKEISEYRELTNAICYEKKLVTWLCDVIHHRALEDVLGELYDGVIWTIDMYRQFVEFLCTIKDMTFLRVVLQTALHHRAPDVWWRPKITWEIPDVLLGEAVGALSTAPGDTFLSDAYKNRIQMGLARHFQDAKKRWPAHEVFFAALASEVKSDSVNPSLHCPPVLSSRDLCAVGRAWEFYVENNQGPALLSGQACKDAMYAIARKVDINAWYYEKYHKDAEHGNMTEVEKALGEFQMSSTKDKPVRALPPNARHILYIRNLPKWDRHLSYFEGFGTVKASFFTRHGIYVKYCELRDAVDAQEYLAGKVHPTTGTPYDAEFRDIMDSSLDEDNYELEKARLKSGEDDTLKGATSMNDSRIAATTEDGDAPAAPSVRHVAPNDSKDLKDVFGAPKDVASPPKNPPSVLEDGQEDSPPVKDTHKSGKDTSGISEEVSSIPENASGASQNAPGTGNPAGVALNSDPFDANNIPRAREDDRSVSRDAGILNASNNTGVVEDAVSVTHDASSIPRDVLNVENATGSLGNTPSASQNTVSVSEDVGASSSGLNIPGNPPGPFDNPSNHVSNLTQDSVSAPENDVGDSGVPNEISSISGNSADSDHEMTELDDVSATHENTPYTFHHNLQARDATSEPVSNESQSLGNAGGLFGSVSNLAGNISSFASNGFTPTNGFDPNPGLLSVSADGSNTLNGGVNGPGMFGNVSNIANSWNDPTPSSSFDFSSAWAATSSNTARTLNGTSNAPNFPSNFASTNNMYKFSGNSSGPSVSTPSTSNGAVMAATNGINESDLAAALKIQQRKTLKPKPRLRGTSTSSALRSPSRNAFAGPSRANSATLGNRQPSVASASQDSDEESDNEMEMYDDSGDGNGAKRNKRSTPGTNTKSKRAKTFDPDMMEE